MKKITKVTLPELGQPMTAEQYWYFASLPLEKRRQIVFDNYLKIFPNTLFANQIIMERSQKKKKVK
jgi:hypothetical protein